MKIPIRSLPLLAVSASLILGVAGPMETAAQDQHATAQGTAPAATGEPKAATTDTSTKIPTLAVDARLVNLPVVVRDKKGALIQTLVKDDFSLQVDGQPQTIRYFDKDANLPLTLGLLVDTSRSVSGHLDEERSASAVFLDTMLASEKDRAFIIQFAHQTDLLEDLTNSRPKLQAALKELDTDSPDSGSRSSDPNNSGGDSGSNGGGGGRQNHSRAGTTLYDATFLASDELMAKQKGRKALVLLTDGDDRGSKENLASAIEAAQRSDTILYAIYFKGEELNGGSGGGNPGGGRRGGIGFPGGYPGGGGGYPGGGGGGSQRGGGGGRSAESRVDGKKILERMTHETGGRTFEISRKQSVDQIYKEIAEELRAQYRLGFTPTQGMASEGYHRVDLDALKQKNLVVQTRDGYYTGSH